MIIAIWALPYINVKKPHIGLYKSYSNGSGLNLIRVLEKQSNSLSKILVSPSESDDLPTWMIEIIQAFFKSSRMSLQRSKPKTFGKKEENGVSTPLVLSMRPHAHIRLKSVEKGHLV